MIIYDFGNQEVFTSDTLRGVLIIILFGIFAFLFSLYKPEEKFLFPKLFNSKEYRFFHKNVSKILSIFIFVLLGIHLFTEIKDLVYIKNIEKFENIESVSGRIKNIEYSNVFGTEYIKFSLEEKDFKIIKDSRYISYRNLLNNDTVQIDYFIKESIISEVVSIELK